MSSATQVIAPLTTGVVGLVYGEAQRQKRAARSEANRVKAESDARNAEFQAQQERVRTQKSRQALSLRRTLLSGAQGSNRSTILTSPLGVTGDSSGSSKTLLGS